MDFGSPEPWPISGANVQSSFGVQTSADFKSCARCSVGLRTLTAALRETNLETENPSFFLDEFPGKAMVFFVKFGWFDEKYRSNFQLQRSFGIAIVFCEAEGEASQITWRWTMQHGSPLTPAINGSTEDLGLEGSAPIARQWSARSSPQNRNVVLFC